MSSEVHVFVGPSLAGAARPSSADFVFHGPVAKGDVYRLVAKRPLAIGIIDGYFERVPAVWHKEILWALSQGVHVFGAASMGALRAAELAPFGMVGVGRIFHDFAGGRLTDDDEVTIAHADPSLGYRPVSEAMVNIRATLTAAVRLRLLEPGQAAELALHAKRQFYVDRSYAALFPLARRLLGPAEADRFSAWLRDPSHHVDQKKLDALELLGVLHAQLDARPEPLRVPWTFQHTDAWEQVRASFSRGEGMPERPLPATSLPCRTQPADRTVLVELARLRALEVRAAQRDGYRPSERDIALACEEFRRARGLEDPERLAEFLVSQGLSPAEFERLMEEEACVRRARLVPDYDLEREISALELLVGPARRRATVAETVPSPRSLELETKRPGAIRLRVGP